MKYLYLLVPFLTGSAITFWVFILQPRGYGFLDDLYVIIKVLMYWFVFGSITIILYIALTAFALEAKTPKEKENVRYAALGVLMALIVSLAMTIVHGAS